MDPRPFMPRQVDGKRAASPEYRAWQAMKNRCNNPKGQDYAYYGGRGISYDPRWEIFSEFLADMGERPKHMTLERVDCDADYGPDNCCWASRQEQARNRRLIKRYRGKTVWEIAAELNLKPTSFHLRLWRFRRGEITEEQLYKVNHRTPA